MPLGQAKVTSQNQISVPASVRQRLGIVPGSTLIFEEQNGQVIVKRKSGMSFAELHKKLFPNGPPKPVSLEQMDEAIALSRAEKDAQVMREWQRSRKKPKRLKSA